jgi:pimeloyl-ACP methyl ester carboxylesterase
MNLEHRVRAAEADLFAALGLEVTESFLELAATGRRVRLLASGSGPPVVLLHGVSLTAATWAPLVAALPGHRLLAVDLPGHGLSDPAAYRPGQVRDQAGAVLENVFAALDLDRAPVIANSLGAMFALWYAAAGGERISSLAAVGEPAVAFAGTRVLMPLSLLTVRGLGAAILRSPAPRAVYRRLLARGVGRAEIAAMPAALLDALHAAARRPENARSVASLMHAIDHFRRPRSASVLTPAELEAIALPATFLWGRDAPYLSADRARASIDRIPDATLHVVPGAHGPWLVDPDGVAGLIREHLAAAAAPTRM